MSISLNRFGPYLSKSEPLHHASRAGVPRAFVAQGSPVLFFGQFTCFFRRGFIPLTKVFELLEKQDSFLGRFYSLVQ